MGAGTTELIGTNPSSHIPRSVRFRLWSAIAAGVLIAACDTSPTDLAPTPLAVQADRLAVSGNQVCLLDRSGELHCWNIEGELSEVPLDNPLRFTTIRARYDHLCGLTADSAAYCWGQNTHGQLGDGTRTHNAGPTRVATDLKFVAIHASARSTCALDGSGRAYCWGRNEAGAVGNGKSGENVRELLPTPVAGSFRFRSLNGGIMNCGLTLDGAVVCWGHVSGTFDPGGVYIAPGDCRNTFYMWYAGRQCLTPTPLGTALRFTTVVSDRCALTATGQAYCWGDGLLGIFGDGRAGVYSVEPVRVLGVPRFAQITAGATHACGLDPEGVAYCWGNNFAGQLGIGERWTPGGTWVWPLPQRVHTEQRFTNIVIGDAATCALTADDSLWCWGIPAARNYVPMLIPRGSSAAARSIESPSPEQPASP